MRIIELFGELIYKFRQEVDKNSCVEVFEDAFEEFIKILGEQDLSVKTINYLYDIFIKDMNIYFKNKRFEVCESDKDNYISKSKIKEKIDELEKLEKSFNFSGLITECEIKIEAYKELLESED